MACERRAQPLSLFEPTERKSIPTGKKVDLRKDPQILSTITHLELYRCTTQSPSWGRSPGLLHPLAKAEHLEKNQVRVWPEKSGVRRLGYGQYLHPHQKDQQAVFTNPYFPHPHQSPDEGREAKFTQSSDCDTGIQAPRKTTVSLPHDVTKPKG